MQNMNRGFSLIELLIVMVILSILSFVSFKYIQYEMEKNKIVSDIKNMYGLLQEARKRAFSQKEKINFVLDTANKKACIYYGTTGTLIQCVPLNSSDYNATRNPIKVDKRGTFNGGTIYYTGTIDRKPIL